MILLIDNYDSFTYNLYQLVGTICPDIVTIRNDAKSVSAIRQMKPQAIILSPGPGKPSQAGICEDIVRQLGADIPILGVCLGHQAICEAYGGTVDHAKELMHGKQSIARLDTACRLFAGMPEEIPVARYHSLAVKEETLPEELIVTARSEDNEIMAMEHKEYPIFGLQFHPESVMTPQGLQMIENFINYAKALKEN